MGLRGGFPIGETGFAEGGADLFGELGLAIDGRNAGTMGRIGGEGGCLLEGFLDRVDHAVFFFRGLEGEHPRGEARRGRRGALVEDFAFGGREQDGEIALAFGLEEFFPLTISGGADATELIAQFGVQVAVVLLEGVEEDGFFGGEKGVASGDAAGGIEGDGAERGEGGGAGLGFEVVEFFARGGREMDARIVSGRALREFPPREGLRGGGEEFSAAGIVGGVKSGADEGGDGGGREAE